MRNVYLSVSLSLLMIPSVFAQQDVTETRPSGYAHRETVRQLQPVTVEAPTQATIKSVKNGTYPKSGDMYVIGLNQPVALNVANSGVWTSEGDNKVWRLKLKADGAEALSLLYSDFRLPEGGSVYVYNSDFTHKSRAYVGDDNTDAPQFATEAITGEEVVLEYVAPAYVTEAPVIEIEAVTYIFRSGDTFKPRNAGENGDSESCEVNVNCSEGSNWLDQKRGVAKIIVIDGNQAGLCTGSLVNNTAQDCKNYFLTAQHCGGGATAANLNQWTFYFNFESPNCNDLTNSQAGNVDNQTKTGCSRRAASGTVSDVERSDFMLVEITGTIPAAYNVYYNGWDKGTTAAASGVGIHHPAGDIKKISTYSTTAASDSWTGTPGTHWRVKWVATANGHGVTEGGSSGSPLFNQAKRIVGDLSGGSSYCSSPNSPDLYGKFSYSWESAGTTDATRLKPWLDAGATNATTLDGRNACNVTPTAPVANFTGTPTTLYPGNNVTFTQTSTNNPTTYAWAITPNTGLSFQSGTTTSSPNPVVKFNTPGTYTVTLTVSNSAGSDAETKTAYITVINNAGVEELAEGPASVNLYPNPTTDWLTVRFATAPTEEINIRVTDLLGKTVAQTARPGGTQQLQISTAAWAQGVYQVEITTGTHTHTQKVVKN